MRERERERGLSDLFFDYQAIFRISSNNHAALDFRINRRARAVARQKRDVFVRFDEEPFASKVLLPRLAPTYAAPSTLRTHTTPSTGSLFSQR
jgi:hypothetical protein